MKRRFFVHITGTVEEDTETARSEKQTSLEEMTEAVKISFRPDLQWGVEVEEHTVFVFQKELP